MKIVATADLHADHKFSAGGIASLAAAIRHADPDVLIIAGDLVGLGKARIAPVLQSLAIPGCELLIVPGNHDLWLAEGDSLAYYREELPRTYAASGFHMLDTGPRVHGEVAFVGNIGWYDYSFCHPALPPSEERSYEHKTWRDLYCWTDGVFVRLGMSDREFNRMLLAELSQQIASLPPTVQTIVAVTHHVGFAELFARSEPDPRRHFIDAYLGSQALGELLLTDSRVRFHLCGHTHMQARLTRDHLKVINIGSGYRKKSFQVIEL